MASTDQRLHLAQAELRRLWDERSQLRMQLAELNLRWWEPGSPARIERAELKIRLEKNAINRRHITYLIERIHQAQTRSHETAKSGRTWSDQMVSALTHLCEQSGNAALVKQAKKLVAQGWPTPTNQ